MPSIWTRMTSAYYGAVNGWLEPGARPGVADGRSGGDDFAARLDAYRLYEAFADQNGYRDAVAGMGRTRAVYGMYDGVRDLLGCGYQLAAFWPGYLMGGSLDPKAGDGKAVASALPIIMETEVPAVREGLAELFKHSRLQSVKETASRFGTVFGDVFWEVCDDADAETVRMSPVPPGDVRWVDLTRQRNVEAYEFEYWRPDPRDAAKPIPPGGAKPPWVQYNERVEPAPNGGGYRFQTWLGGQKYAWPGNPSADWVVPDLPFAPLVKIQHVDVGGEWGRPEAYPAMTGMREVSDLASCLTDWARRAVHAQHLMSGMKNPALDPATVGEASRAGRTVAQQRASGTDYGYATQAQTEGVRTAERFLWSANDNARAQSLVHPLPVGDLGAHVDRLRTKMVEDYPELMYERQRMTANVSGETIRQARKPAETKINARRVGYDEGTERAFKMALTLGGLRGYRHYEAFGPDSYEDGSLDFRIDGDRPAFPLDPNEANQDLLGKYQAVKAATDAGLPLDMAMREAGYSEDDVKAALDSKAKQDQASLDMIRTKQQMALADTPGAFGQ